MGAEEKKVKKKPDYILIKWQDESKKEINTLEAKNKLEQNI